MAYKLMDGNIELPKRTSKKLQIVVGIASICFIAIGIMLGDNAAILRKAIFVCMECIGIG